MTSALHTQMRSIAFTGLGLLIGTAIAATLTVLSGCDSTNPGVSKATASTIIEHIKAADPPPEVYLPRRHAIDPNAVEGNVRTYEHD